MTGTSRPIDRDLTAALRGFVGVIEHTQDCMASRDFALELLSICAQMAVTWSRLAQDIFTMVMNELPDAGAAGPSRRYVEHHASEEESGDYGASERQELVGLCQRSGQAIAGPQV
jgi:hypothetical protein